MIGQLVSDYTIAFLGVSRSGNHPVMNWIAEHWHDVGVIQLNNIPFNADPVDRAVWNMFPITENHYILHNEDGKIAGLEIHAPVVMFSYENVAANHLDGTIRSALPKDSRLTIAGEYREFLFIRDVFNLIASLWARFSRSPNFKTEKHRDKYMQDFVINWKSHAEEFCREKYLPDAYRITYTNWFTSEDYRALISKYLGRPATDAGLDHVTPMGAGSSFDGMDCQGKAREMDVFNRWKNFIDDDRYWSYIDKDAVTLNAEVFGESEAHDEWIKRCGS